VRYLDGLRQLGLCDSPLRIDAPSGTTGCSLTSFGSGSAGSRPSFPLPSSRPAPAAGSPEGKIKLDVLVTDEAGRPVTGLGPKDFTLLDNKKPRAILSFRAVDGVLGAGPGEPPVQVILLVDVTNTPLRVVGNERYQIESFLRRNGGRLTQPTSLMIFDDRGVKGQPHPTKDGNRLADELNKSRVDDAFDPSHGTD
jgi:hypothetical protein